MNHQVAIEAASAQPLVGERSELAERLNKLVDDYGNACYTHGERYEQGHGAATMAFKASQLRIALREAIGALASKQPAAAPICSACGHPLPPGGCSPGERCNAGEQPAAASEREDARRYRWLRDNGSRTWLPFRIQWHLDAAGCDSVIDKEIARAAAPSVGET